MMHYTLPKTFTDKIIKLQKSIITYDFCIDSNQKIIDSLRSNPLISIDDTARLLCKSMSYEGVKMLANVDAVSLKPLTKKQEQIIKDNYWSLDEFDIKRREERIVFFLKRLATLQKEKLGLQEELYMRIGNQIR